jgi:WD40 repeat protein
MTQKTPIFVFLFALTGFIASISAQQPTSCSLPAPEITINRDNIFNDQQDQWLGDAQADWTEPNYLLLPASKSEYLTQLGNKLLAQLPPTPIHYTFRVFESDNIQSFALAGGHIYVSRKLILDAHNEDELAGILAHEIAISYTRHIDTDYTLSLANLLHVKSLGDQADVNDKIYRIKNIPKDVLYLYRWKPGLSVSEQESDELLADRVGFYAAVKAGYAPQAFNSITDRASLNAGYKGNFLTDMLDLTTNVSMRVRELQKMTAALPAGCRGVQPLERAEFKAFQSFLSSQRINSLLPPTSGLKAVKLDPPMSPALENVRLSPDGNYLLAQDEHRIHVLSRAPLKLLFSIDAPDAKMAQFTPDSSDVVFYFSGLRFEDWNVATQKRVHVYDISDYNRCLQDSLSPDGHTFACFTRNYEDIHVRIGNHGSFGWVKLEDLRTGKTLYENSKFYTANFEVLPGPGRIRDPRQAAVAWSQDGRYFLAASGTTSLAYDVLAGKTVELGKDLSHLTENHMAFVDSNKLLFQCDWGYKEGGPRDTFKMCYNNFPDGNPLNTFEMGRMWMSRVTSGTRLVTGPSSDGAATLFDPASKSMGTSFKLDPVDLAGNFVASEAPSGGVSVGTLGGSMETAALPVTPLASVEAARFSLDGRYLAVSDRARGAVWDLNSGKQIALGGPFRNAQFDAQGKLQARIADQELKPSSNVRTDMRIGKVLPASSIAAEKIQYGSVIVQYKPLERDQELHFNAKIEAVDATSGNPLWSRRFPNTPPIVVDTDGDQLLLLMDRRGYTGGDEIDHNKRLVVRTSDEYKELTERGLVVEVISRRTGVPERLIVAPEVGFGSRDERMAALYGDLLAIHGDNNDSVVYRTSDGARLLAFSGHAIAGDASMGLIAANNRQQDVTVYDVATGKEVARVTLDHFVLAARFIPEKRQLLVLTATQRVYVLDLPATGPAVSAAK